MAKFLSIILVGLFFKILIFEPSTLIADNLSFKDQFQLRAIREYQTKLSLIIQG